MGKKGVLAFVGILVLGVGGVYGISTKNAGEAEKFFKDFTAPVASDCFGGGMFAFTLNKYERGLMSSTARTEFVFNYPGLKFLEGDSLPLDEAADFASKMKLEFEHKISHFPSATIESTPIFNGKTIAGFAPFITKLQGNSDYDVSWNPSNLDKKNLADLFLVTSENVSMKTSMHGGENVSDINIGKLVLEPVQNAAMGGITFTNIQMNSSSPNYTMCIKVLDNIANMKIGNIVMNSPMGQFDLNNSSVDVKMKETNGMFDYGFGYGIQGIKSPFGNLSDIALGFLVTKLPKQAYIEYINTIVKMGQSASNAEELEQSVQKAVKDLAFAWLKNSPSVGIPELKVTFDHPMLKGSIGFNMRLGVKYDQLKLDDLNKSFGEIVPPQAVELNAQLNVSKSILNSQFAGYVVPGLVELLDEEPDFESLESTSEMTQAILKQAAKESLVVEDGDQYKTKVEFNDGKLQVNGVLRDGLIEKMQSK